MNNRCGAEYTHILFIKIKYQPITMHILLNSTFHMKCITRFCPGHTEHRFYTCTGHLEFVDTRWAGHAKCSWRRMDKRSILHRREIGSIHLKVQFGVLLMLACSTFPVDVTLDRLKAFLEGRSRIRSLLVDKGRPEDQHLKLNKVRGKLRWSR